VRLLGVCSVACLLALIWFPLAPDRLWDFDAANFALALDHFQPALHQPQPPGYPLYVGLARMIRTVMPDVWQTFLVAGLIGARIAIVMLWTLGERIFGTRVGIIAALLFLTNPILWQTAMTDQVRVYIAVVSIAVPLILWPGWYAALSIRRFATACFFLGLLSGFRPEMLLSLAPFVLIVAIRARVGVLHYIAGTAAVCLGALPWMAVLVSAVGGPENLVSLMRSYAQQQAGGKSLLFGAPLAGALKMLQDGFWWLSLGFACWIPAAFAVRWRETRRFQFGFLLAWFAPLFVFSLAVHIAASGHALSFIPILCLAGGWVVSQVGVTRNRQAMGICLALALFLNVLFFFKPYAKGVKEASYKTVKLIGDINGTVLDRIDAIAQRGPVYIVTDGQWLPWRTLEYYYPSAPVLYLGNPPWLLKNRAKAADPDPAKEIQLPSTGMIVWLVADDQPRRNLLQLPDCEVARYFIATPARPAMHIQIGRYRFATTGR